MSAMPFYRRSRSFGPLPTVGPAPQSANASVLHSAATPASQPADPCEVGYAVVDLETTGLSPATDAILEIGLVLTAPDGTPQRTWSTLINPGAGPDGAIEVGPTFIHYMAVGRQRGEEPLAWSRTLADAAAFRGWSWDDAAARAQEQRLTRRPGPGVPRAH